MIKREKLARAIHDAMHPTTLCAAECWTAADGALRLVAEEMAALDDLAAILERERDALAAALDEVTHEFVKRVYDGREWCAYKVPPHNVLCGAEQDALVHQTPARIIAAEQGRDVRG